MKSLTQAMWQLCLHNNGLQHGIDQLANFCKNYKIKLNIKIQNIGFVGRAKIKRMKNGKAKDKIWYNKWN